MEDRTIINGLCEKVINASGFVFCGPEYNGGSAPILTNAITWISVTTDYWRDAFSNKIGLKTSIQFNDQGSSGSITLFYSDLDQLDEIMKRLKR